MVDFDVHSVIGFDVHSVVDFDVEVGGTAASTDCRGEEVSLPFVFVVAFGATGSGG